MCCIGQDQSGRALAICLSTMSVRPKNGLLTAQRVPDQGIIVCHGGVQVGEELREVVVATSSAWDFQPGQHVGIRFVYLGDTRREVRYQDSIVRRAQLCKSSQSGALCPAPFHRCSEVHLHQQSAFPVHHQHVPAHDAGQVLGLGTLPLPGRASGWKGSVRQRISSRVAFASCNSLHLFHMHRLTSCVAGASSPKSLHHVMQRRSGRETWNCQERDRRVHHLTDGQQVARSSGIS